MIQETIDPDDYFPCPICKKLHETIGKAQDCCKKISPGDEDDYQ